MKMKKVYLEIIAALLLICILSISCEETNPVNNDEDEENLQLKNKFNIGINCPASLCLSVDDNFLTIGNQSGRLYKLTPLGEVLSSKDLGCHDAEGLTQIRSDSTLWVVEEQLKQVFKYNYKGNVLDTFDIPVELDDPEYGPEGITYNPFTKRFYIVNERNPCLLLELNKNMELINQCELDFTFDCTDVFFDTESRSLWMLSEESNKLFKCSTSGKLDKTYKYDGNEMDGIVVLHDEYIVYMVSATRKIMYEYSYE